MKQMNVFPYVNSPPSSPASGEMVIFHWINKRAKHECMVCKLSELPFSLLRRAVQFYAVEAIHMEVKASFPDLGK